MDSNSLPAAPASVRQRNPNHSTSQLWLSGEALRENCCARPLWELEGVAGTGVRTPPGDMQSARVKVQLELVGLRASPSFLVVAARPDSPSPLRAETLVKPTRPLAQAPCHHTSPEVLAPLISLCSPQPSTDRNPRERRRIHPHVGDARRPPRAAAAHSPPGGPAAAPQGGQG